MQPNTQVSCAAWASTERKASKRGSSVGPKARRNLQEPKNETLTHLELAVNEKLEADRKDHTHARRARTARGKLQGANHSREQESMEARRRDEDGRKTRKVNGNAKRRKGKKTASANAREQGDSRRQQRQ